MKRTVVAIMMFIASSAGAQGTIKGIVADSLHAGPLTNAEVVLDESGARVFTGADGLFEITNVAPGNHTLSVFHPLLDSLGIALVTRRFTLRADSTTTLMLAVPSVASLLTLKCGANATSAIIGTIARADDDKPVSPAPHAVLSWSETEIGRSVGIRTVPRSQSVDADVRGHFRICNVPSDVVGRIVARTESDSSSSLGFTFTDLPFAIVDLTLPTTNGPLATIRGSVSDSAGKPLQAVRVWLTRGESAALTDAAGQFVLGNQLTGSGTLKARKLGYAQIEMPVTLSVRTPASVRLEMRKFSNTLPDMVIAGIRSAALDRVGFNKRKQRRPASLFLGPDQMDMRRNRYSLTSTLAESHDLVVMGNSVSGRLTHGFASVQGACVAYIVDGDAWPGEIGSPIDFFDPAEIGAMEVYSADDTPRELPFAVKNRFCAHVVMWTRAYLKISKARK
jgi:hypothetical protein